jgi:hypothetical protein
MVYLFPFTKLGAAQEEKIALGEGDGKVWNEAGEAGKDFTLIGLSPRVGWGMGKIKMGLTGYRWGSKLADV